jgi:hypothetical protein
MPMTRRELIEAFGAACDNRNAALFVGAGLSKAAGLPDWEALLEGPRVEMNVPLMRHDFPLMAEYIGLDGQFTPARMKQHIMDVMLADAPTPTATHRGLRRLPVDQIWTTNYDPLIETVGSARTDSPEERSLPAVTVIASDEDIRLIGSSRKSVIKMHGSISPGRPPSWASEPVLTRSDYENYETNRPRTWALLRAAYLSRTLLFLGFSFADPNIEVLQRLARVNQTAANNRHMTVLRRPDEADKLRSHELLVRDLEKSGVRVHEIDSHDEVTTIVSSLVRRTRAPRLFVSGSDSGQENYDTCCEVVASALAGKLDWELNSLGGPAGWRTGRAVGQIRRAERTYDAAGIVFHFRRKDEPAPALDERVGTAVYTELEREELVRGRLDESRAVLLIGGGSNTREEANWAAELGAGVVPLAISGGTAREYWEQHRSRPTVLGGQPVDAQVWERLNDDNVTIAVRAAVLLLEQAMYSRG